MPSRVRRPVFQSLVPAALALIAGCRAGQSIEMEVAPSTPAEVRAWGDEPYVIVENRGPGLLRVRLGTSEEWPLLDRKLRAGAVMSERTAGDVRVRLDAEARTTARVETRDVFGVEQRTVAPEPADAQP